MPVSRCARVNLLGKQGKEIRVSAEENKAIVRRWFEDLFSEWAMLGSNQRPLPCEGSALPLS
jgi:hypothetical protein